jgi:hypothetical protein
MAVLPSLVYVFDNKVLSDTALVPSEAVRCDNGLLDSKARIVGLDSCMLGTDHHSMSLNEFLEAHVENESRLRKDGRFQRSTILPRRHQDLTLWLFSISTTMAFVPCSSK